MNANQLKEDLFNLKTRLENIEGQLEGQLKELEVREEKWKRIDEQLNDLLSSTGDIVKFNIGGKVFHTRKDTLLKQPDSLLGRLVESDRVDLNEELFFDRTPKYFPYILDYLRFGKINYKRFNKDELKELTQEVNYYEIAGIREYLNDLTKEVEFVSFESSGTYSYNGTVAGTNKVEDLKDRSLTKGICATSPGWIIIELNGNWEFEEIEVGGFNGNSNVWYAGNGASANVSTSQDKEKWVSVGTLPSNHGGTVQTVRLTRSTARYIKFNNNAYMGIGYLKVKKLVGTK